MRPNRFNEMRIEFGEPRWRPRTPRSDVVQPDLPESFSQYRHASPWRESPFASREPETGVSFDWRRRMIFSGATIGLFCRTPQIGDHSGEERA